MKKTEDMDQFETDETGLGPNSGGQSGDLQGLDSEGVAELLEEGQSFEAGIVSGILDAPEADEGGIRTREVPEDDVPLEYQEEDDRP
jgi:hypothetical protein